MPPIPAETGVPIGVIAKAFLGGLPEDYRVVLGKGGTLLSEHIKSGRKVPAVEVSTVVEVATKAAAKLPPPVLGALVAGVAVATVGSGLALNEVRKLRKQLSADQAADPGPPGASAPILMPERAEEPLLMSTEAMPDETVLVPVRRPRTPMGRARQARKAAATGLESVMDTGTDRSLADAEATIQGDRGEAVSHVEVAGTGHRVDWAVVTPQEVARARTEHEAGLTGDAVQRLRQLLHFLDELPGKNRSPIYPAITLEPLTALVEFSQSALSGSGMAPVPSPEVVRWAERLTGLSARADGHLAAQSRDRDGA